MSTYDDLLEEAYWHDRNGNNQYAKALLESLVSIQPHNVEAWEAYLQLCQTCEELDFLCERVVEIDGLSSWDIESILDYYYFLRQNLKMQIESLDERTMVKFELIDQFTYTLVDHKSSKAHPRESQSSLGKENHRLPGKVILIFYFMVSIAGIKLMNHGTTISYLILLAVMVGILMSLWKMIFPKTNKQDQTKKHQRSKRQTNKDAFPIVS